jgi:hypothetical protein
MESKAMDVHLLTLQREPSGHAESKRYGQIVCSLHENISGNGRRNYDPDLLDASGDLGLQWRIV